MGRFERISEFSLQELFDPSFINTDTPHYSDDPNHRARSEFWKDARRNCQDPDQPVDKVTIRRLRAQMFRDPSDGRQ